MDQCQWLALSSCSITLDGRDRGIVVQRALGIGAGGIDEEELKVTLNISRVRSLPSSPVVTVSTIIIGVCACMYTADRLQLKIFRLVCSFYGFATVP